MENKCPLYSTSEAGAKTQNDCVCNPGYMSQGKLLGTSPCVKCPPGVICPGGGLVTVAITDAPQPSAETQLMLVQQPLPAVDSLVTLLANIPSNVIAVQKSLPSASMQVLTRQVCRGSYCISCDGSTTCVPYTWVGVSQGPAGRFVFNVSSVAADTLLFFVPTTPGMCRPVLNLPAEYINDTVAAVASVSSIASIPVYCPTNALIGASIHVTGTTPPLIRRRRLLESRRSVLQASVAGDGLMLSVVVPSNLTNATQSAVASANLVIQGYSPILPVVVNSSGNTSFVPMAQCPANSTSQAGAVSVAQCVCLPGYKGNASAGVPCAPCEPGVFCSGGLLNLCPANSNAPPMSNSSKDCRCNPGFYGSSKCAQCPANAYCTGGQESYANCTPNAVAPAQSTDPSACYCQPGLAGVNNAACQVCSAGAWCWTGVSNQCPPNRTSKAGSTRATDCGCSDGYMLTSIRDSDGSPASVCVTCTEDAYCKVRTSSKGIYNRPPPRPIACCDFLHYAP